MPTSKHIAKCKQAVQIPVIASLNGTTTAAGSSYAKEMQQAGADALELNIYYIPVDPDVSGAQVEQSTSNWCRPSRSEVTHSGRGQARALLQLHGQHGQATGRGRRRWPGAVQSLLPAGLTTWKLWKWCPT